MTKFFSLADAGVRSAPNKPPLSAQTLRKWHDAIGAPRDSVGRRIFSAEVCAQICEARAARERTRSAA